MSSQPSHSRSGIDWSQVFWSVTMSQVDDNKLSTTPSKQLSGAANGTKSGGTNVSPRPVQPDGGWGWVVYHLHGLQWNCVGIINTYGTLYVAMRSLR
ncbi:hypothetical protein Btru_043990 [Bulinus truncatus]|nr:hypothetical protein Btru_043990 [Bulinus truncatus]